MAIRIIRPITVKNLNSIHMAGGQQNAIYSFPERVSVDNEAPGFTDAIKIV